MIGQAEVGIAQAAVAYTHRADLVLYVRCQEEAHHRLFTCDEIRRMVYEMLKYREDDLTVDQLRAAIFADEWCPALELFNGEEEGDRFADHPPCG